MTPLRIGLLTTSYPRFEGDIAGCFVDGFAQALEGLGHKVEVLAPAARPTCADVPIAYGGFGTFYGDGVLNNLRRPNTWPGLLSFPLAARTELRKRSQHWDAFVSHWALPNAVIGAGLPMPRLSVWHSADVAVLERLPFPQLLRPSLRGAMHWFVSEGHRERVEACLGPLAQVVAPMGIEVPKAMPQTKALKVLGLKRAPRVFSLGRLVPLKGFEVLEQICDELGEPLTLAGEGPMAARLGRSQLLGVVQGPRKDALYAAGEIFVLPSVTAGNRTEGVPLVLLEAMAAGKAIVATDAGGVGEVLRDGDSGLLVPPANPQALRDALRRLLSDAALRERLSKTAQRQSHRWADRTPVLRRALEGAFSLHHFRGAPGGFPRALRR